jgi:hypothetical protein
MDGYLVAFPQRIREDAWRIEYIILSNVAISDRGNEGFFIPPDPQGRGASRSKEQKKIVNAIRSWPAKRNLRQAAAGGGLPKEEGMFLTGFLL